MEQKVTKTASFTPFSEGTLSPEDPLPKVHITHPERCSSDTPGRALLGQEAGTGTYKRAEGEVLGGVAAPLPTRVVCRDPPSCPGFLLSCQNRLSTPREAREAYIPGYTPPGYTSGYAQGVPLRVYNRVYAKVYLSGCITVVYTSGYPGLLTVVYTSGYTRV